MQEEPRGPSRHFAIFLNLILTCMMLGFMSTAMSTALAPVMVDFGVSASAGQWLTSGYTLALAITTPFTAYLTIRFKTKRLYLASVGAYAVASLGCALAPGFIVLLLMRIVQACANALIANVTQVSILTIVPQGKRGQMMGWFGMSQGASVVLGPVLGGLLCDLIGWRAVFFVVAFICLVSFVLANFTFYDLLENVRKAFDLASFVLSGLTFGLLTLGLGSVASGAVSLPLAVLALLVGAVSAVAFVKRQLASESPFLKVQLVYNPAFAASLLGSMLLYLVMAGSSSALPLYVQLAAGQTASVAGIVALPGALAMALVSPFAGRVYDKLGIFWLALAAAVLLFAANALTSFAMVRASLLGLSVLNVVRCVAIACVQMPLQTWGNTSIDKADMPHGSALITALRNVAGSLGVVLFVSLATAGAIDLTAGFALSYGVMAASSLLFAAVAFVARRLSE